MNITEFMDRLSSAYSLFTPEKAEVWTPVYAAALKQYEGPVLAQIFRNTLQEFKATSAKAWPAPLDFQRCAPATQPKLSEEGPSLREPMKRHGELAVKLMDEWWASQGLRIQEARGALVAVSCKHIAGDLAKRFAWRDDPPKVRLTVDQIELAVSRTVSRQRVIMFGPLPKKAEVWREQMEQAKAALTAPRMAEAAE